MKNRARGTYQLIRWIFSVTLLGVFGCSPLAWAQTTHVTTEYLLSYYALLDAPSPVDGSLMLFNIKPGGWVKGPKINGKFMAPGGDWLRIMPSGVLRLDVKGTILTDDNQVVYISYNGIVQHSKESAETMNKGELVTYKAIPYFITTPSFQTSSEKYNWMNSIQCVGKMVEVKIGEGGYIKYDVFVVR